MTVPDFMVLMQKIYNHPKFDKRRDLNWFDNAVASNVRVPVGDEAWSYDVERALDTLEELEQT